MKILVTGTPGVGKTTLSKEIAEAKKIEHIDISAFIKSNKIYESYNKEFDSLVFDENTVKDFLNEYIKNKASFIIDTHSPTVAIDINFDFIFHITCSTSVLGKRLADRKYSETKIMENLESEIFNVIGEEIEEYFGEKVWTINGSGLPNEDDEFTVEDVFNILDGKF